MIKTENQVWALVFQLLNGIISRKQITGWTIRQGNQPTVQNLRNGSIYITRVTSRRYGWQGHYNKWNETTQKMEHKEKYIEEIMFQVSAFKKRDVHNLTEATSSDIINLLITFLQSLDGVKMARSLGFQIEKINEIREPSITTDSELYEKLPQFDITIVVEQIDDSEVAATNKIDNAILKGI